MTHLIAQALTERLEEALGRETLLSLHRLSRWMGEQVIELKKKYKELKSLEVPILSATSRAITANLTCKPLKPARDEELRGKILRRVDQIQEEFSQSRRLEPKRLQILARPLKAWAKQLGSLSVVDELLKEKPRGHFRDAAVFAAAVIIYERLAVDYYDSLVELIQPDRPLRSAAMWRVLRAIQQLLSVQGFKLSDLQQDKLFQALVNARCYDEKRGTRFSRYTIPRKILDIAKLSKTGLSRRLSEILTKDQYSELQQSGAIV